MSEPVLSVLVPCLSSRPFRLVIDELQRQRDALGERASLVELLWLVDDGELPSGEKRNRLTRASTGRYVAFVDDDDRVSADYLSTLAGECETGGVNIIAFDMEFTRIDRPGYRETWKLGLYMNDRPRGRMTVNQMCAWQRSVALSWCWPPNLGYADDHLWFEPLFRSRTDWTCRYLDRTLYHYLFDPTVTSNQRRERMEYTRRYVGPTGLRCWKIDGEIVMEDGSQPRATEVLVRERSGGVRYLNVAKAGPPYHAVRVR